MADSTALDRIRALIKSWRMALAFNQATFGDTVRASAMRKLLSELEEAMNMNSPWIDLQASFNGDDEEVEKGELLHVFETTCTEATQGEISKGKRYQSATLATSEAAASPTVRVAFAPAGGPMVYGKRYRVTIEELP